jgi:hypothetical protein
VAILGVLSSTEIQELVARSHNLREARQRRHLSSQLEVPPPKPPRPASIASNFSASSYSSSSTFFARSPSPNRSEIGSDGGWSTVRRRDRDHGRRKRGHSTRPSTEEKKKLERKSMWKGNSFTTASGGAAASLLNVLTEAAEGL